MISTGAVRFVVNSRNFQSVEGFETNDLRFHQVFIFNAGMEVKPPL